ncbi:MAG: hypothetical protein JSW71_06405 [Gemmatimonadota bacterium]|nr:MAG: hypothetical protein JSW71_06405 [Gemmatimonadota bacterium]
MRAASYIRVVVLLAISLVVAGPTAAQQAETDAEQAAIGQRFKRHMSGVESCLICHGSYNIVAQRGAVRNESLWINPDRFLESTHARFGCHACHTNIDPFGHRLAEGAAVAEPPSQEAASPGTEATAEAGAGAPAKPAGRQALEGKVGERIKRTDAMLACGNCHLEEYRLYKDTVHGVAVLQGGNIEPPFCTDCHGWHYVLPAEDERALTNPANIPRTCQNCHGQAEIKRRYGLTKNVAETFEHSFHSRRGELGSEAVAVCTSCHGWHDIYAADDPRSRVNTTHVSQTCGECHQGAQLNFAAAFTHGEVSRTELVGVYAVTQTHKWLIVLIIGPLVAIVLLDIFQAIRRRKAVQHE